MPTDPPLLQPRHRQQAGSHSGTARAIIGGVIDHNRAARAELTAPGAPFAIEEIVVRGVRIKTFAAAPPDLRTIWEGASAIHADKLYMVYENERFTFAEAWRSAERESAG